MSLPQTILLQGLDESFSIEGLQAHASAGNGIELRGGRTGCFYCVASGAGGTGLAWDAEWSGIVQYAYIRQGSEGVAVADDAGRAPGGLAPSRPGPVLSNATLVGHPGQGTAGLRLRTGAALAVRNTVITGFGDLALDIGGLSLERLLAGTARVEGLLLHGNRQGAGELPKRVRAVEVDPLAANVRREGNPDPRPWGALAGQAAEVVAEETDPRAILDWANVGAFGHRNWLEGWTFFGPEEDYVTYQLQ